MSYKDSQRILEAKKFLKNFYNMLDGKGPFKSYQELEDHYRYDEDVDVWHDDTLVELGGALEIVSRDTYKRSLETLVNRTIEEKKAPHYTSFFNVLSNQTLTFTFEDVKAIAKETADDVKEVATASIALYAGFALIGLVFFSKVLK